MVRFLTSVIESRVFVGWSLVSGGFGSRGLQQMQLSQNSVQSGIGAQDHTAAAGNCTVCMIDIGFV